MYSIKRYLLSRVKELSKDKMVDISRSPIDGFHYATNLLHVCKELNPEKVLKFWEDVDIIEKVEINRGFLNFRLNKKKVVDGIISDYLENGWNSYDLGKGKRVLIEFVSANPTGPLNAVNGRSATFGLVLSNVLRYFNYKVFREYYINDVGEQIEKLVDSFIERIKEVKGLDYCIPEDGYRGQYLREIAFNYVNSSDYSEDRNMIKNYIISYFVNSHKTSLLNFGVSFDNWFKQSDLVNLDLTIDLLRSKGFLYEKDGAIYFRSTFWGDDKDRVVKKTTGKVDYTYFAYDIEYIKNKFERNFEEIITILGPDHHGYVNRLLAATKALGYDNHKIIILQIVNVVEKDKALKMSKRKGVLVLLDDLISKTNPDFLRYFFISRLKDSPLDLDIDFINRLTLDNPLYYIFYVYARINGIIRNYVGSIPKLEDVFDLNIDILDEEFDLFLMIQEFRDSLISSINDPYYLTLWANNFSKLFHRFYNSNKIICANELGKDREKWRMILMVFSKGVLEIWSNLLNIKLPERM